MADGRVVIDVVADDEQFKRTVSLLGRDVEKRLKGMSGTLGTIGDGMTKYITAPFLAAAGAAVFFGVKSAASFEQTSISFETMLGSAAKGQKMFSDLKKFAAETPFELPGILDASKKLLAFGFNAGQIIPTLRSVGDAAAGLGLGTEGMERIITALGQIKAKGKASAEEMLQLAESGLPAWEAVATKIGVSIPEAMKMAERGAIDADTAISALTEMMDKKFGGMMLKQSTTLSGLWSTFKDVLGIRLGEAFQANLEPLKTVLIELTETAGPFIDALIPAFMAALEMVMPVLEGLIGLLQDFSEASLETQGAIMTLVAALVLLGPALNKVVSPALNGIVAGAKAIGGMNLAGSAAEIKFVATNMNTLSASTVTAGGAAGAASIAYVALAAAAGLAIGNLINKIPAVKESADALGQAAGEADNLGEYLKAAGERQKTWVDYVAPGITATQTLAGALGFLSGQQKGEQVATDETVAAWKAAGISLDENNNLTDLGERQLAAHAAASRTAAAATGGATTATRDGTTANYEYRDSLVAVRNEQIGAERADIALEQSKNRLEDAQRAYTQAVAEYGPTSREAEDAMLTLRGATLDVEDATNRAAAANDTLNKKLSEIPMPDSGNLASWLDYYQRIGDKAAYAALKALQASGAVNSMGNAKSGTGGYNIPLYGSGSYVTRAHLAVVGDAPEVIIPLGDEKAAAKFLPILYASLPQNRGGAVGSVGSSSSSTATYYQIGDVTIPSDDPAAQQVFSDLMRLVRQYQRMKPQGAM